MTPLRFELWVQLEVAKTSCLGIIDTKIFGSRGGEKGISGRTTSPVNSERVDGIAVVVDQNSGSFGHP